MKADILRTPGRKLTPREMTAKHIWDAGGGRADIAVALGIKLRSASSVIIAIRGKGWPVERRLPPRGSAYARDDRSLKSIIGKVRKELA